MTFDESLELSLEQNSGLGKPKGVCSCGRVAVKRRWAQWQGDRDSGEGEDGARPGAPCMWTLSSVFLTLESRGELCFLAGLLVRFGVLYKLYFVAGFPRGNCLIPAECSGVPR